MDAASEVVDEGAIESVITDRAETPQSLGSGNDGVWQPRMIESSQEDVPANSDHGPPLTAMEYFEAVKARVKEAIGQNHLSGNVGERDNLAALHEQDSGQNLERDLETGLETGSVKNEAVLGKDSEARPGDCQQDSYEDSQCRVCHTTDTFGAMTLGCNCKRDLARVHKGCAEKWFRIRGNRTCEICGAIARNVHFEGDSSCQWNGQEGVVITVSNAQRVRVARSLFVRSIGICLLWVVLIIFLYKFLVPILRKIHNGRN